MKHKYYAINLPGSNVCCKAYYTDRPAAQRAVVCCTGFGGHKDNRAAEGFAEKALSKYKDLLVLTFDWPAHGDDIRKKTELGDCDAYLQAVLADARERFGVRTLYCYATSFGGYLTLKYISEHGNPFERIALRCPAVDMYATLRGLMSDDEYERILRGRDTPVGFDRKVVVSKRLLEDLQANDLRARDFLEYAERILILHGTKDEVVPLADSRTFAEDNLIELVPVENADHRFQNPASMSLATKLVLEFFDLGQGRAP